jgi:class 3 adenylate cyclase/tetratricopeptide (TPR) repeat protein
MNQDQFLGMPDARTLAAHGTRALEAGKPFEALEAAIEGLRSFKGDVRLRQIQGLALARSGAWEQANVILGELAKERHPDAESLEETLGILARTHKDFALVAVDLADRQRQFRKAQEIYAGAYRQTGRYWTGINAATLATLLDEKLMAAELARAVRDQCQQEWNAGGGDRYYLAATLGEAELNLNDWGAARRWYREAADVGHLRYGDVSSTRRQARLLSQHLGQKTDWIDALLYVPKVAVFVGHMCDQPGRLRPRFPDQLEPSVRNAIRDRLKEQNALIGFSSAACGSDILFLETLLELQGEPHVVLPYEKEQFARISVDIVPGWRSRYDTVIEKLTSADKKRGRVNVVARGKMELESASYDYANQVLHGLAVQRAKELDTELVFLAVWDGRPGDGAGGTASVVERWRNAGLDVNWIDLAETLRKDCPRLVTADGTFAPPQRKIAAAPPSPETKVLALLFADAVGFSKLSEPQAVKFTKHCLGAICKALLEWDGEEAIVRESRGDGVYLAFERVGDAGLFALHLQDLMKARDWAAEGLPAELKLRIGLHAGPVCRCFDPILGAQTWTGAHVSHAARIEPKVAHGQVYASQQFAALAALDQVTAFSCDYVGTAELDKGHGTYPLYVLRRRST